MHAQRLDQPSLPEIPPWEGLSSEEHVMSETSFELLIGDICGHGYWWSSSTPTVFGSVFGGLTAARNTLARLGGYGSYEYDTLSLLIDIFIEKNTPDL